MKIHNLMTTGATAELVLIDCKPMLLIRTPNQLPVTLHPTVELLKFFKFEAEYAEILEWLKEQELHEKIQAFEGQYAPNSPIEITKRKRLKF